MNVMGHPVKIGMTWDELQPLLITAERESLIKSDEDSFVGVYIFKDVRTRMTVTLRREMSPYKLTDYSLAEYF
jgi:hypothetical protein